MLQYPSRQSDITLLFDSDLSDFPKSDVLDKDFTLKPCFLISDFIRLILQEGSLSIINASPKDYFKNTSIKSKFMGFVLKSKV